MAIRQQTYKCHLCCRGQQTFPEDQYDMIFCRHVTHWIENKQAMFRKISRSLHTGGQFAMVALIRRPPITDETSQLMGSKVKEEIFTPSPQRNTISLLKRTDLM